MRTYCLSFLFLLLLFFSACNNSINDHSENTIIGLIEAKTKKEKFAIIEDSIMAYHKNKDALLKYLSVKSRYLSLYKENDSAVSISKQQLRIAKKSKNSLRTTEAYYKLGLYNRKRKEDCKAIIYFDSCLTYATANDALDFRAKAHSNLGNIFRRKDSLEKSFYHLNQAFKDYTVLKDSSMIAARLLQMGNIQKSIGDFLGSLETAVEGCKYAKPKEDTKTLLGLYQIITTSYRELKNYKSATEYNDKAFDLLENTSVNKKISQTNVLICKNTRANLLKDQGRYEEAIQLFEEIIEDNSLSKKEKNRSKDNLGFTLWLQNKQNPKALNVLKEVLNSRLDEKDFKGLIASNIHLMKFFMASDRQIALSYAQSAAECAEKVKSLSGQKEALGYILQIKDDASEEGKRYQRINDQLEKLQQDTRDIYVGSRFQNDQLKEENFRLEITNANQRTNMILSISILFFLFIGSVTFVLFLRSKFKRDKMEAIIDQTHKTEVQISQKVHDELANDMANTLQFIQQHPKIEMTTKDLLAPKLDNLYERTRDIATEISSFDLAEFTESLRSLIIQYHVPGVQVITNIGLNKEMNDLPNHKKTNVYRCIQELLINTKKHSEANELRVIFRIKKNVYSIEYSDNGKGCDLEKISKRGLKNVESRIRDIGGTLTFKSSIGEGFRATLKFKSS